jgi:hypothetical protein
MQGVFTAFRSRTPGRARAGTRPWGRRFLSHGLVAPGTPRIPTAGTRTDVFPKSRCLRGLVLQIGLALVLACLSPPPAESRILQQEDVERISSIKANFITIMVDLNQALRNPDLSGADRDCIDTIRQDLIYIGEELSGYENLMKIESELNEFSDDRVMGDVVRFAMTRALDVLDTQRRRLRQPPDQCARLPASQGKAQSALQIIEVTVATLEGVRTRLARTGAGSRAGAPPQGGSPPRP